MEVRSYRRVFDLERRIYSIDSLRLNPSGVPVRGVVYFIALLVCGVIITHLPLFGLLAYVLPWYMLYLALPGISATILCVLRIEGRTFHLAATALVRFWVGPRRLCGLRRCAATGERWWPQDVLIVPDGSDPRMRAMRYTGPGAVRIATEHERTGRLERGRSAERVRLGRRAELTVRECAGGAGGGRGQVILLSAGTRMLVRGSRKASE
jgi:hypothetical protein